jgi:hypothetical protein
MKTGPLQLVVPALMVALGLFCIVRPRVVATWIERMFKADIRFQAHPAEQLTVKPPYVVAIGIVYLFMVVYFFILPSL